MRICFVTEKLKFGGVGRLTPASDNIDSSVSPWMRTGPEITLAHMFEQRTWSFFEVLEYPIESSLDRVEMISICSIKLSFESWDSVETVQISVFFLIVLFWTFS